MPRPANPALETLWRRRLRQQPDSGLTIHQFCKREGVSTASFHAWKRRLALRTASPTPPAGASAFVPVILPPVHEPQPRVPAALVTIQLANGGRILLPVTASVELVCEVVGTVARLSVTREGPSC
jgi:hypothetical protein